MTDLNFTPDVQSRNRTDFSKTWTEARTVVKHHNYSIVHNNDTYNGDGEDEDYEESVFHATAKEFPKRYLEHDSEIATKENQACATNPECNEAMSLWNISTPHHQVGQHEILQ